MIRLTAAQYARFKSAVNSNFGRFEGKHMADIMVGDDYYVFIIDEFDEYEIVKKGTMHDCRR